ncbi:class I SAM-dependent methyltransferase [Abyssalbus ytuae]|uniref:Class I SAM-dependent methyltransferase n=1 Tax=Abyssalbus ytuae TaxID=2926907 RepID=A0A9E7CZT9_9FLAO|nr:class I SAM-dependent methyltransferase [Abyssalbus ytuae]UOB17860.1 class I SAM-dependent methyltransferase [Abyssalbus ytuae]
MENLDQNIERHYLKEGLLEDIINRLKDQNISINNVRRSDISGVDEFHVRGAAVSRELAQMINLKGLKVLDVGCGLGGACRMLADEFNCDVTGLDLSNEYIRTAKGLSKLVRLENKTRFIRGNAVNLPFENSTFDVVWTQHVQMNIPDKTKFYTEICRVLNPDGYFLYYDIFKNNNKEINYPMPWANTEDLSFLAHPGNIQTLLTQVGLQKVSSSDQTREGIIFFENLMNKLKTSDPPKIGLNILMGETTRQKLNNLLIHLKKDILTLEAAIYKKAN